LQVEGQTLKQIDPATEAAARAFLNAIAQRYPVTASVLFGSRARGDFEAGSDADLAVVLSGPPGGTIATMLDMIDAAYEVELDTGLVISPLPIWQLQWEHPEQFSNPSLLRAIKQEGVRL
jgi:predicted nucleotidyltransferase